MATEKTAFLAGGRLYFTPENGTAESEIGWITDAALSVETQTAECLSRDNGISEVVAEAVIKRDYQLTFTTGNVSSENLARFFYGANSTKTYTAGDTYRNGKILAAFDANELWSEGDLVIENTAIYEAIADTTGEFDEAEWKRLGGAEVKLTAANKINKVTGRIRVEGEPVSGKKTSFVIYKANLAPSGDFKLMGDEYSQLVFTAKCQRTDAGIVDIFEEAE